jgi:hypothetical protein
LMLLHWLTLHPCLDFGGDQQYEEWQNAWQCYLRQNIAMASKPKQSKAPNADHRRNIHNQRGSLQEN